MVRADNKMKFSFKEQLYYAVSTITIFLLVIPLTVLLALVGFGKLFRRSDGEVQ